MSPIPLHSHAPTPNSAPTFFFISSHTQVLCLSLYLCQMLVTARTYWMLSAKIWDKQLPWKILIVSSTSFTVGEAERWSNNTMVTVNKCQSRFKQKSVSWNRSLKHRLYAVHLFSNLSPAVPCPVSDEMTHFNICPWHKSSGFSQLIFLNYLQAFVTVSVSI